MSDTPTAFDRGPYSGQGNVTSAMKRATMVRAILDDDGKDVARR